MESIETTKKIDEKLVEWVSNILNNDFPDLISTDIDGLKCTNYKYAEEKKAYISSDIYNIKKPTVKLGTFSIYIEQDKRKGTFYLDKSTRKIQALDPDSDSRCIWELDLENFLQLKKESNLIEFNFRPLEVITKKTRPNDWQRIKDSKYFAFKKNTSFELKTANMGKSTNVYVENRLVFKDIKQLDVDPSNYNGPRPAPATCLGLDGHKYYLEFFHDGSLMSVYQIQ